MQPVFLTLEIIMSFIEVMSENIDFSSVSTVRKTISSGSIPASIAVLTNFEAAFNKSFLSVQKHAIGVSPCIVSSTLL